MMMKMSKKTWISALLLAGASLAQATAVVGQPAPAFTISDSQGKTVSLADYKGKHVVLEWVNPGCPFVKKHYDSGNIPNLQKDAAGNMRSFKRAIEPYIIPIHAAEKDAYQRLRVGAAAAQPEPLAA